MDKLYPFRNFMASIFRLFIRHGYSSWRAKRSHPAVLARSPNRRLADPAVASFRTGIFIADARTVWMIATNQFLAAMEVS
jgi:hypothetical protein